MKFLSAVLPAILLVGCSDNGGTNYCTVYNKEGGATVSCTDGTEAFIPKGEKGEKGGSCTATETVGGVLISCGDTAAFLEHGKDGQNAQSCHVSKQGSVATLSCPNGQIKIYDGIDGVDGKDGVDGVSGSDGKDGADGKDGESCSISKTNKLSTLTCGGVSVDIVDGKDGQDGLDGEDGDSIEVIDPCPEEDAKYREVLLQVGNTYVSYFKNNDKEFLTRLSPGRYQTTDGRKCYFSIPLGGTE